MAAIAAAAIAYVRGGYHTVVDCVIGPWHLSPYHEATRRADVPLHYVVLRPSEGVALRRATGRSDDTLVAEEPVRDPYRQFADLGSYEANVLDTSGLTVASTVETILGGLQDGRWRVSASPPSLHWRL